MCINSAWCIARRFTHFIQFKARFIFDALIYQIQHGTTQIVKFSLTNKAKLTDQSKCTKFKWLKNSFQLRRQYPSVIARFIVDAMHSFQLFCVSFGSLYSFTAVTPAKSYLPRNCFLPPLTLPGLLWEVWELFLKPKPSHLNQLKRWKGFA